MSSFLDRLKAAFSDFAKGWGESTVPDAGGGEDEEVAPALLARLAGAGYAIEERVGSGGMALVYRARDRKHDRVVAIKVLRPELASRVGRERFLREIRLAARLTHPHILPLHDSGEAGGLLYYVMPFVEGASLRERLQRDHHLPEDEALEIARAVGAALDYAHRQGVIHRDIKPENIMIHDGVAVVTDFGIGKALSAASPVNLTQAGVAIGTPAYMSPEQMYGEGELDGRSDLYSLGLVLAEMLTGDKVFTGPTPQAVLARRAAAQQPDIRFPPTMPESVKLSIHRVLSPSPADRPATGGDLVASLTDALRVSTPTAAMTGVAHLATAEPSIAVLPFTNMSGDAENEYFSDGVTEEIINALTQIDGLRVAARTSSFAFKGKPADVGEVGRRLNVATVLEGSVRQAGSQLRVTAQLVNVADGYHLWSERWDRELDDVFAVQDEIAIGIAGRLKVGLATGESAVLVRRSTGDLDAYQLYLKGRHLWNRRSPTALAQAVEFFQQAIDRDPKFALAYSGLADTHLLQRSYRLLPRDEGQELARAAARRALELDETLAEAHTSLGQVLRADYDWSGEEREYRRAIDLNPSYATAHHWYATNLAARGRMDEALKEIRRAEALDPLSHAISVTVAILLDVARDVRGAERQLHKTLELDPDFLSAIAISAFVHAELGRFDEALAANDRMLERAKEFGDLEADVIAQRAMIHAWRGDTEQARAALADAVARGVDPGDLAFVYTALGEKDAALESLERGIESGSWWTYYLKVHPLWDPIRSDPRFARLLQRVGLADDPIETA